MFALELVRWFVTKNYKADIAEKHGETFHFKEIGDNFGSSAPR